MFTPTYAITLFSILVLDLTMNNGSGFRIATSVVAYTVRQVGLS